VPILYQGEILGVMYGDRITQASTYQPEDVDFFAAIAQQVGVGLANLRLLQEHLKSQKLYAELEQARTIQRRLLPSAPLQLGRVRIEGYNEPSSAVGGDYYDYFELEDGKVGLIIADVTGHGLAAALVMANLQSVVRVALTAEAELTELAARLNRLICQNTAPNVFITALLGKLDPASAAIDLVSAGHPLPIVVGAPATDLSDRNALPLGIDPDEKYEAVSLVLPGSARGVLLYTDGLIEASSPSGQILGVEAVESALTGLTPFSTREVIRAARGAVRKHLDGQPNTDDMTLLAVQLNA
jgi:sigma-B regulation protein RsbU (phosphoserine phosphatase)